MIKYAILVYKRYIDQTFDVYMKVIVVFYELLA